MDKDEGKLEELVAGVARTGGGACRAAGSGSTGFSGALNDPAIYLALNTLGSAICHKPQASLCAIRLPLNCSKLAVGFFHFMPL